MSMCNMCSYAPTIGDSFVWLQLISSYHGVSTAKCRVRATDRGHLMMSDDFGSKSNDEKARQEAATILWRSRRCLRASLAGTYCERPALQRSTCWNSSDVAVVTVMPVIARWESPLPLRLYRDSPTKSVHESAGTFPLLLLGTPKLVLLPSST